jgi:hypothetical protein
MNSLNKVFNIVTVLILTLALCEGEPAKQLSNQPAQRHDRTDWRISPSFKFDTLCFLNTLTGDSYYLEYYKDEYVKFEPQLTPATRTALANLKRKIKDENRNIISAFLCLYFSATDDQTLDEMLKTLENSKRMQSNLKRTLYYSEDGWRLYESVREDLRTILRFLKNIRFDIYWEQNILPQINRKVVEIEKDLTKHNVIAEVETQVGFALTSNTIDVYMLYYSQPHGIKITGTRFLTDVAWPFRIVLRNAVHEMMHPPFDLANDRELKDAVTLLKADTFLMDKVLNHNPAFGYNSLEGFIEEDSVQALEQVINEKLQVEIEAHKRWKENDAGMHVFAVALYNVMKEENFNKQNEPFRSFLVRMIRSGKLSPGKIKKIYDSFYSPAKL